MNHLQQLARLDNGSNNVVVARNRKDAIRSRSGCFGKVSEPLCRVLEFRRLAGERHVTANKDRVCCSVRFAERGCVAGELVLKITMKRIGIVVEAPKVNVRE